MRHLGWDTARLAAVAVALAVGGAVALSGRPDLAAWIWGGATALVLVPTTVVSLRRLLQRDLGVDLIAVAAMGGALLLGEHLAGAVIALMMESGGALERYAGNRAQRELTALLARAPQVAHRVVDGALQEVPVAEVGVGDRLVVKSGEVVPADGVLTSADAVLDESALTGESRPVEVGRGDRIRSGTTNAGGPLEIRVTQAAAESTYAGVVRMVQAAAASKAPFVRLADRFALGFLLLTAAVAGAAWALSGDATRALAVLVVATPCPLILAAPAAIVGGVSRAARHGILVKGGAPLEALARVEQVLFDKTGTVTASRPRVVAVQPLGDLSADEIVRLAAAADQMSVHAFGQALISEARDRGLDLPFPESVSEAHGSGLTAVVGGRRVTLGQRRWVAPDADSDEVRSVEARTSVEGSSAVYVAVDDRLQGAVILADPIRPEAPRALAALRALGVARISIVTGDHADVADLVGDATGVDEVFSERTPEQKVEVVQRVRERGLTLMVGDGVNDAPALALADVGVAMGGQGATAASEAADVVLTADRLDSLVLAVRIAKRSRGIAMQSVLVGMGLSGVAMIAAGAGYIPPVAGAVLQEGIDVAVILNALRALGGPAFPRRQPKGRAELAVALAAEHRALRPRLGELMVLASQLDRMPAAEARASLASTRAMLVDVLLVHEDEEQRVAYPVLAQAVDAGDPTGPLVRTHQEIHRLVRLFARLVDRLAADGPGPADVRDLQRLLYGLHAILTLHFAQEEELYSELDTP